MKEITKERIIKTKVPIYVSDDGLYESEDKFNVEQYEKSINKDQPVELFESNEVYGADYNLKVYKCSNFEEFQAVVAVVCKYHKIYPNMQEIYEQYENNQCLYAFFVDDWNELIIKSVSELLEDYFSRIKQKEYHLLKLREEVDRIKSLISQNEEE